MNLKTMCLTALLVLVAVGCSAAETPKPQVMAPRAFGMPLSVVLTPVSPHAMNSLLGRIQTTAEQSTQLRNLVSSSTEVLTPLRQQATEAVAAVREAMFAGKDASTLKAAFENAQKAEDAVIAVELDFWLQLRSILTPEQITKLNEALSKPIGIATTPPQPTQPTQPSTSATSMTS